MPSLYAQQFSTGRRLPWLLASCALGASACFATDPSANDAQACAYYANSSCQTLMRCSQELLTSTYGSLAACQAQLAQGCGFSLAQPDTFGSAAGVAACGDALAQLDCNALWNRDLPAACQPPRGKRRDGAACSVSAQCASARCDKPATNGLDLRLDGACAEPLGAGAVCASADDCALDLVCVAGHCSALGTAGQACSDAAPCRAPLGCINGQCTMPLTAASCAPDAPCQATDPTANATCDAYARALCARLTACSARLVEVVWGDPDRCTARNAQSCLRDLTAPDVVGSAAGIAGCGQVLAKADCSALLENDLPPACHYAPGARQNGAACGSDAQCQSTRCSRPLQAMCGSCSPLAQAEEPCQASSDCAAGLTCNAGVCRAPQPAGASCDPGHSCAFSLTCSAGRCTPALAAGSACTPASDGCDHYAGLSCNPSSSHCEAWTALQPGQSCAPSASVVGVCSAGSHCAMTARGPSCTGPIPDGAACDPSAADSCLSPARCIGGVCALPDPQGCR